MNVARTWEADLARKLGIGGVIDFTTSRVGQTLHIPCSKGTDGHGHIADVKIRPNLDPNGACKQMIAAGWIVGRRRLICPDCRGPKKAAKMDKAEHMRRVQAAITPEQRRVWGRRGGFAKATNRGNGKDQGMVGILEALEPEQPGKPATPTPAAGKAKRLVYMALEDYYDEEGKRYKNGRSDASIAKELNLAEAVVKSIREESFGPLGEPEELIALKLELQTAMGVVARTAQLVVETENKVKAIERKLQVICDKNGWPVA